MTSTVTNFSNNINTTYPVPGVDNDTQGFRDNFSNIKNALTAAADQLDYLQSNTAKLDAGTNDFDNGYITKAVLKNSGYYAPPGTIQVITATDGIIDFAEGSYRRLVLVGNQTLKITNWQSNTSFNQIRLEVYNASSTTSVSVTFNGNGGTLRAESGIGVFTLTSSTYVYPHVFDIWSTDNGATIFLKSVGGPFIDV
jgi:hypothetical protein